MPPSSLGSPSASFAYGFGSERRIGGLSSSASMHGSIPPSPLATTFSYGRLPSRSPFAVRPRELSVPRRSGASDAGRLVATPSRPASLFGAGQAESSYSRADSLAGSRTSSRNTTPKRRGWSSLNLAPPSARRSEGEELMREYASMRSVGHASADAVSALFDRGRGVAADEPTVGGGGSLKRYASMSVDSEIRTNGGYPDDVSMSSAQPQRKRQMVWDAELGFVTRQEQRAHQTPSRPVANNEAERLLNVLEGMRTPLGDARRMASARSTTPSRSMASVPVPLPVSSTGQAGRLEGNGYAVGRAKAGSEYSKAISPHARAMRRSKLSQSEETEQQRSGLRSRLRREGTAEGSRLAHSQQDDDRMTDGSGEGRGNSDAESSDAEHSQGENDNEDAEVVEPPRKRKAAKHAEAPRKNPSATLNATAVTSPEQPKVLRSGKVVATAIDTPHKELDSTKEASTSASKPMSRARMDYSPNGTSSKQPLFSNHNDGKTAVASLPPPPPAVFSSAKDNFSVLPSTASSSTDSQQRNRSSLRQGAQKTSRTHVRSGRIGLDDEADDDKDADDMPDAEELSKIKLPANLFPKDFSFSTGKTLGTTARAATMQPRKTTQAAFSLSAVSEQPKGNSVRAEEPQAEQGSLLSRMGGFAASTTPSETPAAAKPESSPSPSPFAFGPPSSSNAAPAQPAVPSSKPLFSFQPNVSSPLATPTSDPSGTATATSTPAPSSFFSAPSQPAKKVETSSAPTSFQFGASSSFAAPSSNANGSATPTFSFAPSEPTKKADTHTPAASTGREKRDGPVPNFFASSLKPEQEKPAAAPVPAFGQNKRGFGESDSRSGGIPSMPSFGQPQQQPANEKPAVAAPLFSFGTPSNGTPATAPSAAPSNKPVPSFSFGAPSSSATQSNSAAGATTSMPQSTNFFSATPEPAKKADTPATAASAGSNQSNGAVPSFFASSFGKPAQAEPAKAAFTFGQPNTASNDGAVQPSSPFGQQSNPFGSQETSRQSSPAPFQFGAPSLASNAPTPQPQSGNAFGGGFGSAASSAPSSGFTFGNAAVQQPQQPSTPTGNVPFSFSVPSFGAASGPTTPGGGQATHSGTPPPFVFGGGPAAAPSGGAGGFSFGGSGMAPQLPQNSGAAPSLFNIGAPSASSPSSGAPRSLRGLPNRRKKAG